MKNLIPAQKKIELLLGGVKPTVQKKLTLWDFEFDFEKEVLPWVYCGCKREEECPELNLWNLQHLCINVRDFSGNVHMGKNEGVPWVEYHGTVCYSIFNHLATFDTHAFGMSKIQTMNAARLMCTQEWANGGEWMNGGLFKKQMQFKISQFEINALRNERVLRQFAKANNIEFEKGEEDMEYVVAWFAMMKIIGRTITSLNHEVVDSFDSQSMGMQRLWGHGGLQRLKQLPEMAAANLWGCLPLMKKGNPYALQCGNNLSMFDYLDRKQLPSPTYEGEEYLGPGDDRPFLSSDDPEMLKKLAGYIKEKKQ